MKRKCFVLLPLAGMILFFFHGCNKEDHNPDSTKENENSLVYEDRSLQDEVSPNFYDNHIYRIELMGANLERDRIVRAAIENGIEEEFLMLEAAQKFFFNHTEVIMYSIPTLDPEQTLILYETQGLYQVSMAYYCPLEEDRMSFTLKTMDDRDFFTLKLDGQNRLGELKVFENDEIRDFNKAIYSLTYREESLDAGLKGANAECCRKESSWKGCMECTIDHCSGSWTCKVVGIVAPVELIAGFAASCIGAGEDSRC